MKATQGIKELFKQETGTPNEKPEVISYQTMQFIVGGIALGLPVIVWVFYSLLESHMASPLSAISEYYYTIMRDVFVGSLCMVSLFLFAYKGYPKKGMIISENMIFNTAGLLCVLVALFSMNMAPDVCSINNRQIDLCPNLVALHHREWFGWIHNGAATLLFIILGFVSLFLFTKTDDKNKLTPDKKRRIFIYRLCGIIIWATLAFYVVCSLVKVQWPSLLFVVEFICLEAFGLSWLVKAKPKELFKSE
ncbi:MAG: hypothetical protein U0V74_16610 [Chitinophagales bacterium]